MNALPKDTVAVNKTGPQGFMALHKAVDSQLKTICVQLTVDSKGNGHIIPRITVAKLMQKIQAFLLRRNVVQAVAGNAGSDRGQTPVRLSPSTDRLNEIDDNRIGQQQGNGNLHIQAFADLVHNPHSG